MVQTASKATAIIGQRPRTGPWPELAWLRHQARLLSLEAANPAFQRCSGRWEEDSRDPATARRRWTVRIATFIPHTCMMNQSNKPPIPRAETGRNADPTRRERSVAGDQKLAARAPRMLPLVPPTGAAGATRRPSTKPGRRSVRPDWSGRYPGSRQAKPLQGSSPLNPTPPRLSRLSGGREARGRRPGGRGGDRSVGKIDATA